MKTVSHVTILVLMTALAGVRFVEAAGGEPPDEHAGSTADGTSADR